MLKNDAWVKLAFDLSNTYLEKEICKNEVQKMFSDQQLNKDICKEENANLYLPVTTSKTPICVLKKKSCTKSSKPDNTDIIYSSSIRNIDGKQVPKIVLVKERANKIVAIQNNDDTTELHIEEVHTSLTNSNSNSNDNSKSDNIGKHNLPMRISERRSIAEPLRPLFATSVPNMIESQPKPNEETPNFVRQPNDQQAQIIKNDIKIQKVGPPDVALPRNVVDTSIDVPEDLSVKSTRSSRYQNIKRSDTFSSRNAQVLFSSEKDRVLPNASIPSIKYVEKAPLQQPPQQELQVPQQSPCQLPEPHQHSPTQKLFIHSPQQSPHQQYLQSTRHYSLQSNIRPQIPTYLPTPQHSPIIQQQQNSQLQHSPLQHSPLHQMQHQFINAPLYQQKMQYHMMQQQAANSIGRRGSLGNSIVRQQPQTITSHDQQQLMMQIMMQQQYPAMQFLNDQHRIAQPVVQSQQQMVQHQMAELQPRFSPHQQQLLAQQQSIKRQSETNIPIGNRQSDTLRSYPYVPYAPYSHQIRKVRNNSPVQFSSDNNSQEYWYNLPNLNSIYPTNLHNKSGSSVPEMFDTNLVLSKISAKKRNAKIAKVATKPVFEEPASKLKRLNVLPDFTQDFSSHDNCKSTFSNEERSNCADLYNMQPTNVAKISMSCSRNVPTSINGDPRTSQHYTTINSRPSTGRNRELFEDMTPPKLPNRNPYEFGEYYLNNTEVTIRKLKANENCGSSSLLPLSSASIYNAQNCSKNTISTSVSEKNAMLRNALSFNKSELSKTNITTLSRSTEEDPFKNKISSLVCDSEELDELYQNCISKDIDPLVTTLSNANKRKLFQLSYLMNKRPKVDHVPIESNHQIIVKNDIASSGCIVTNKNDMVEETENSSSIKIITSEREIDDIGNDPYLPKSTITPKSSKTEALLLLDIDCAVDLSISRQKNNAITIAKAQEVDILPTNTFSRVNAIYANHNEVQEKEVGISSPKLTMEEELTSLEAVLSHTESILIQPNLTHKLNNTASPSLSETAQELSRTLSTHDVQNSISSKLDGQDSSTENDFEVLTKELEKDKTSKICEDQNSLTTNDSEAFSRELDTETDYGIKIQFSESCVKFDDQGHRSTENVSEEFAQELNTEEVNGIENQICIKFNDQGSSKENDPEVAQELDTEQSNVIKNHLYVGLDDQGSSIASDAQVFAQELDTKQGNSSKNQLCDGLDDQGSSTANDFEVFAQELHTKQGNSVKNQLCVGSEDEGSSRLNDSEVFPQELDREKYNENQLCVGLDDQCSSTEIDSEGSPQVFDSEKDHEINNQICVELNDQGSSAENNSEVFPQVSDRKTENDFNKQICVGLDDQGSSTESDSEASSQVLDSEKDNEIINNQICVELDDQGSSTENDSNVFPQELDRETNNEINNQICVGLDDQGSSTENDSEVFPQEFDRGKDIEINNQFCVRLDNQGSSTENDSEVFPQVLDRETNNDINNQICVGMDDQGSSTENDSEVFSQVLDKERDNEINNQVCVDLTADDSEIHFEELDSTKAEISKLRVNLDDQERATASNSEVLSQKLVAEKEQISDSIVNRGTPPLEIVELVVTVVNTDETDQSNEMLLTTGTEKYKSHAELECEDLYKSDGDNIPKERNSEEMTIEGSAIQENTISSASNESVAAIENSDNIISEVIVIDDEDDDDINSNNLAAQNFVISRDLDSMNVVEVTITETTPNLVPSDNDDVYSVDDSGDEKRNWTSRQCPRFRLIPSEIITLTSDSDDSEPEYIDQTVTDNSFRKELRKKFRKKIFTKKLRKHKPVNKSPLDLRNMLSKFYHIYLGWDKSGNVHEGNVNNSNKSVNTVLSDFNSNTSLLWRRNTKIFLKRSFNDDLCKFQMNIPEAIVCLKHMMRTISTYVVPLPEAKFRFILECQDVIKDFYMQKYFKTLHTPKMNRNMPIVRLDESVSDGRMEAMAINSQASSHDETVDQETNVDSKNENDSSQTDTSPLSIQSSEENEKISDSVNSNLESQSPDEKESLRNDDPEGHGVSQTKECDFSGLRNDTNVETNKLDVSLTSNLESKLHDLEECNSDAQTFKNSRSAEDLTDNPDILNKMETCKEDINNNTSNISSKVLVESTDFHAENEQITENLSTGKHLKMKKRFHNKKYKEKSNETDNYESFSDKENDIDNENRVNEIKSADFNFTNENDDSQRGVKILQRQTSNKNIGDINVIPQTSWKKTNDVFSQVYSKNDENRKSPELSAAKTIVSLSEVSERSKQNLDHYSDDSFEFFEDELRSCLENGSLKSLLGAKNRNQLEVEVINKDGSSTSRNIFEDCKVFNIQLCKSISIPKSLFQFNSMNLKDLYKENNKITIVSKVVVETKPKEILKRYLNSENRNSKKDDQVELYKENVVDGKGFQNSGFEVIPKNVIVCDKSSHNNLDANNQKENSIELIKPDNQKENTVKLIKPDNQRENSFKLTKPAEGGEDSEENRFQHPTPFFSAGAANYTTNTPKPQSFPSTKTVFPQQRPNYYYQHVPPNNTQHGQNMQNYPNSQFKQPYLPNSHQNAQATSYPNFSATPSHLEVPKKPELLTAPPDVNLNHVRHNVVSSFNKEVNLSNERRFQQPKKFNKCYPRTKVTNPSNVNENKYSYYPPQPSQPEAEATASSSSSWNNAMQPNSFPAQNQFSNIVTPFNRNHQTQNVVFQKMQFLLSILHRGDILSPEEYVREIQILHYHQCPRILLDFYTFITKSQIYVNVFPISFRLFLEYHYAGKLKELEVAFVRYVESHERERQQRLKNN